MRKPASWLVVSILLVSAASAQTADFKIEKLKWQSAPFDGTFNGDRASFSIDLKNTGTRRIITVEWEVILNDTLRREVYDRFHFVTDDKKIEAGKIVRLTKRFPYVARPYTEAIARITRVRYSDGSVWEPPR